MTDDGVQKKPIYFYNIYLPIYIYVCICVCIYIYIHVCIDVYMYNIYPYMQIETVPYAGYGAFLCLHQLIPFEFPSFGVAA